MSDKEEEMKEKKKKWRIIQNGKCLKIDKRCALEADVFRWKYGKSNYEKEPFNIRRVTILKKALRFCQARATIRLKYRDDDQKSILEGELKAFDSNFYEEIHKNPPDVIDLTIVSVELRIRSLYAMLLVSAVRIMADMDPKDIEKILEFRLREGDQLQFEEISFAMMSVNWPY